ncbi:MAG: leucine-rich repeat domain-containing protein [Clostridia bacterium]|nr:leucine-rich repeat domain-containing protein [Clostridia bacterium]
MAGNGRKDAPRNRGAGAVFWLMVLVVMLVLLDLTAEGVYASDFYTAPDGTKYNKHDYERLKAFLEQQNGGVKNGNKIEEEGKTYKPEDPGTWGGVTWSSDEPKRVVKIIWADKDLVGNLDLSECTALQELFCNKNKLSSLSVRNCNSLVRLSCYENQLTNLDLSGCSGLMILSCDNNLLWPL